MTGLGFGLACLVLPRSTSTIATLVIVPVGMALVAYRWMRLYFSRPPASF